MWVAEPLRERFPVYLKVFSVGLAAIGVLALIVLLVSSARPAHAFGYSALAAGTLCLLVGGAGVGDTPISPLAPPAHWSGGGTHSTTTWKVTPNSGTAR